MLFKKRGSAAEYIIVGLGNPDSKYRNTRHNIGFMAAERIGEEFGCRWEKMKYNSLFGRVNIGGAECLLVKPMTYMNNSGQAVRDIMQFYKVPVGRVIVLCDDIALDVGRMRIRSKGSAGGHNGLKDIIALCGGEEFARVRMGVGAKPHPDYDLADWVLSRFTDGERKQLDTVLDNACKAVELMVEGRISDAMNRFNR